MKNNKIEEHNHTHFSIFADGWEKWFVNFLVMVVVFLLFMNLISVFIGAIRSSYQEDYDVYNKCMNTCKHNIDNLNEYRQSGNAVGIIDGSCIPECNELYIKIRDSGMVLRKNG